MRGNIRSNCTEPELHIQAHSANGQNTQRADLEHDLCELPDHEEGGNLVLRQAEVSAGGRGRAPGSLSLPLPPHAGCAHQLATAGQHTLLQLTGLKARALQQAANAVTGNP